MSTRAEPLILQPPVMVAEAEYRRLLGYPRGAEPSERALELAAWARAWFNQHHQSWLSLREARLTLAGETLRLDGVVLRSRALRDHLRRTRSERAFLLAVSAGPAGEEYARARWEDGKPDEYFFLETFGSAVVEQLVAAASGLVCAIAATDGCSAVPLYSPGYNGWDVAEQNPLFRLLTRGATAAFPQPLDVLSSGMLRPKKSLLGVIGLASYPVAANPPNPAGPCRQCSFSPCQYRRVPYRHAPRDLAGPDCGPHDRLLEPSGRAIGSTDPTANLPALESFAR